MVIKNFDGVMHYCPVQVCGICTNADRVSGYSGMLWAAAVHSSSKFSGTPRGIYIIGLQARTQKKKVASKKIVAKKIILQQKKTSQGLKGWRALPWFYC